MNFEELEGKTLVEVTGREQDDEMIFKCSDGTSYRLYHDQSCCETVYISDICGDIEDILNTPIVKAEESSDCGESEWGTYTWTFYKIDTEKGGVTIRWNGESNGYYSEYVDFEEIK